MKQLLLVTLIAVFGVSCRTRSHQETATNAADTSVAGCYAFDQNNSQVTASLEVVQDSVKGRLHYDFYEKDDNAGQFAGTMHGDTLFGVCTFYSEGQQSKREVAFLVKEDQLLEGYGDTRFDHNIQRFEATDQLNFGQGVVLTKTECNKDSTGYLTDH